MLNKPMRVQRIRHRTPELVIYPRRLAVRRHQRDVHLHLLRRVAVFGALVPEVFILAGLGGFGVELVGEVFDRKCHGRRGGADDAEGCEGGGGLD